MGVGVRPQHAGDDELGAGEFGAQHAHEGDRAAFALDRRTGLPKAALLALFERGFQPRRQ